jgi:hypothetical protein
MIGLLEADAGSAVVLSVADALLGGGSAERLQVLACGTLRAEASLPWEPCLGDEMAVLPYHRAQEAVAEVTKFHGERLNGRRSLVGLGVALCDGIVSQAVLLGGDVVVVARGPLLSGAVLSEVVGRCQLPTCVVAEGFGGSIRKVGVAIDFAEGSAALLERAMVIASNLGVELVPVHAARAEVEGERRGSGGGEAKRFEQLLGQLELPFGAAYATRNLLQPLEVVRGEPSEALQAWASTAPVDLVVVGSGAAGRPVLSPGQVCSALIEAFPVALWVEQLGNRE